MTTTEREPILVPSAEVYAQALRTVLPRAGTRRRMLTWHHAEPSRITTATDMAQAMGWSSHHPANGQYGGLGQTLAEALGHGDVHIGVSTLVTMVWPHGVANVEWLWIMRPQVAAALEQLGWVQPQAEYLWSPEKGVVAVRADA